MQQTGLLPAIKNDIKAIEKTEQMCYTAGTESQSALKAAYPPLLEGKPSGCHTLGCEGKEGEPMYVTYRDLVQLGTSVVALVGLCYTIFKGKK